jgi:hypothetical protein
MARKLKIYQTSLGFFDQATAAPSMKAALKTWGADSLFHQVRPYAYTSTVRVSRTIITEIWVGSRVGRLSGLHQACLDPHLTNSPRHSSTDRERIGRWHIGSGGQRAA